MIIKILEIIKLCTINLKKKKTIIQKIITKLLNDLGNDFTTKYNLLINLRWDNKSYKIAPTFDPNANDAFSSP